MYKMKRVIRVLLFMGMLWTPFLLNQSVASAEEYDMEITVTEAEYGADGTDSLDDYSQIQKALSLAWQKNISLKVHIPAGTYYISDMLEIYSNTYLQVDAGAMIINTSNTSAAMICCSHRDENGNYCGHGVKTCNHGGHSQWSNIIIEGGTWNAGVTRTSTTELISCVKAEHGYNVIVRNGKFMNTNIHILNFSATQKVLVENCWLQNNMADNKKFPDTDEALHLDYTDVINEPDEYPHDRTAVDDVMIRNNTFYDVGCAIGAHSTTDVYVGTNITIENNQFLNVKCNAVNMYANKGVIVRNNVMSSTRSKKSWCFLYTVFGEVTLTGNQVSNCEAVWVKGSLISDFKVRMDHGNKMTKYYIVRYAADMDGKTKYLDRVTTGTDYTLRKCPFKKKGYRFVGWYGYNPMRNVWKSTTTNPTKWLCLERIKNSGLAIRKYSPGETVMNLIPYHHYTVKFIAQWKKIKPIRVKLKKTVMTYDGKVKKPEATVYEGAVKLNQKHYRVIYRRNKKIGTARVTIKGRGDYAGQRVTTTFRIKGKHSAKKKR